MPSIGCCPLSHHTLHYCRLSELLELHKLHTLRQGIDIQKLSKGDTKGRKQCDIDEDKHHETGRLKLGAKLDGEDGGTNARARCAETNNFTQQTSAVGMDKHMMAHIKENLKIHGQLPYPSESKSGSTNAWDKFTLAAPDSMIHCFLCHQSMSVLF
ncbi:hypothetical protein BKA83DRAFT_4129629 [Pisolithus microcarpus]|nr:hypothetical protein BKA83DRAFT_4129629 [Pisolithus microcarpus]